MPLALLFRVQKPSNRARNIYSRVVITDQEDLLRLLDNAPGGRLFGRNQAVRMHDGELRNSPFSP
jgi:hypothetical protein